MLRWVQQFEKILWRPVVHSICVRSVPLQVWSGSGHTWGYVTNRCRVFPLLLVRAKLIWPRVSSFFCLRHIYGLVDVGVNLLWLANCFAVIWSRRFWCAGGCCSTTLALRIVFNQGRIATTASTAATSAATYTTVPAATVSTASTTATTAAMACTRRKQIL